MLTQFDTLIGARDLAGIIDACIVLDCRASLADPSAGRRTFAAGHLPGAVYADLATDLAAPHVPGRTGRHPLPNPDALARQFRHWGIGPDSRIVAYDADSGAFAARAWWLARWLGHDRVAVLDGGFKAWIDSGGAVAHSVTTRPPGSFSRGRSLVRVVGAADLTDGSYILLDARAGPRFRGEIEPIDPVAGHIPGALSVPYEDNLAADLTFQTQADIAARLADLPEGPNGRAAYCGSGVTACHLVLAMRHAGLPEPALYAGSWSDWILDPGRPTATGP